MPFNYNNKMIFHHIGIACKSIPAQIEQIKRYHGVDRISEIVYDKNQDVDLCMLTLSDNTRLELISGNKVKNMVQKGQTYYHLCYQVNDIDNTINELVKNGAMLVSRPIEAPLFNGKRIAFLYLSYGLVELVEINGNE